MLRINILYIYISYLQFCICSFICICAAEAITAFVDLFENRGEEENQKQRQRESSYTCFIFWLSWCGPGESQELRTRSESPTLSVLLSSRPSDRREKGVRPQCFHASRNTADKLVIRMSIYLKQLQDCIARERGQAEGQS